MTDLALSELNRFQPLEPQRRAELDQILIEISQTVADDPHVVLRVDQSEWHSSDRQSLEVHRQSDVLLLMQWNGTPRQGSCWGKYFVCLASPWPFLMPVHRDGVSAMLPRGYRRRLRE